MRAGQLRDRVTLQEVTETRDSFGAVVEAWSDVATVWAEVADLSGREYFDAQQTNAELKTRIRIRYRSGVVPKMRAVFGSRVFDIESVIDPDSRRRELHLMCKEVVT